MPVSPDLATVEADYFEPLLHGKFSALAWDGPSDQSPVELELVRVMPQPLSGQENRRVPFSLFFDGPAGIALIQGTYALTHPQTGEMPLFLVPVGRREDHFRLQAVLN